MALTADEIAQLQRDIPVLKAAIATGATKVRYRDREVTYRAYSEMRQILRAMERELEDALGIARPRRTRAVRFVTSKGLC